MILATKRFRASSKISVSYHRARTVVKLGQLNKDGKLCGIGDGSLGTAITSFIQIL